MKKITTTYKEFFDLANGNPDAKYYVKTPTGFSRINAVGTKTSDTVRIDIQNCAPLIVADRHAFMNAIGEPVMATDLVPGDEIATIHGLSKVIGKTPWRDAQPVYDISIDSPHWYFNTECDGVIHHNTLFVLSCAKSYLDAHKDAVMIFYDSEFGTPKAYFDALQIPSDRVFHSPITTIEQLRTDISNQLEQIKMGDHVFIAIDSVGNLASSKEVNDAKDGSTAADMTRAKVMKSTFRIVTPHLSLKGIPCFVVNHTYKSMSMYPTDVVSGGSGIYYSASTVFIIGRRQVKEGTEVTGYDFIINVDKSRFVREKSKLPISVSFEHGVQTYSGIFELGLALGFVNKESVGWYTLDGVPNKLRAADFLKPEIAKVLLNNPDFVSKVESAFSIANSPLITDDDAVESADEDEGDE